MLQTAPAAGIRSAPPLEHGAHRRMAALRPELVVEIRYDHVSGNRFRHGTKLMRWHPDKAPR